jgi:hypothetical protein
MLEPFRAPTYLDQTGFSAEFRPSSLGNRERALLVGECGH